MSAKLNQIFKNMSQIEPSVKLKDSILRRIEIERSQQIRRKLVFSYSGMIASFSAAVYTLVYFGSAFFRSEFWSIFTLIFSDAQVVAGYWKTYLYSLMETLPVANIIVILVPVFGFLMFFNWLASLKRDKIAYRNIDFHALQH